MILLKIFYFLKGYVIIDIIDGEGAKLLNILSENNIHIWNVTATKSYAFKRDFEIISQLAKRNAIAIEFAEEISFYSRYLKNCGWFLAFSAMLVTTLFLLSSLYVWDIEINGCDEDTKAEIMVILNEKGLHTGVLKSSLPDGNTLKDSIIYNVEGVNWAWVYLDGTLARVEVSVGVPPPLMDNDNSHCNISAARDGIITSISAKNGRALFSKGDRVSAGDIIISGAMPGGVLYPPYTTRAEGEVYAETVHTQTCIVPLYKTYTKETGDSYTLYTLRLFSLEIPLGRTKVPFDEYRTDADIKPLGICKYRYTETTSYKEQISLELAADEAREALYEKIAANLAHGSVKTDERTVTEYITEDSIKVTLAMTFRENIGVRTPIELWQTEELKNDETN
ncbi:MAG: sporulation protein YqfD [Clostridia bacterium]|nr:sporulation protein YqfD [Clostridia bacterium]